MSGYPRRVRRRTVLKLPALLTTSVALPNLPRAWAEQSRWTAGRADGWYRSQNRPVGANYITSSAVNQLEMFQAGTFDPARIDTELFWARLLGLNTIRVFLHDQLWTQDSAGFTHRLGQFVAIAARHQIKPLFVLLDSCWDPCPRSGPQREPTAGVHNSGWVQSPGAGRLGDGRYIRVLRDYITGVLGRFRNDDRILGWDLWNEPDNPAWVYRDIERSDKQEYVADLLPQVFRWARSVGPRQPLTSAVWDGEWADAGNHNVISDIQLANSDVITFHCYGEPAAFELRIAELAALDRPIICTEYLARPLGSTIEEIMPIAKRHNVGALNWGLVAGKTQTYLPWDSWEHPYPTTPEVWFHDLLRPDGRPHRYPESEVLVADVNALSQR